MLRAAFTFVRERAIEYMATKHTNTTSARKVVETRKNTSQNKPTGTRTSGTRSTQTTVKSRNVSTRRPIEEEYQEELVPELNNELILLVTLVVSVLLFLSNFRLSGTVGELINQVTFGLFGVLAYVIPFFLFFGVAFYLANHLSNRRYIIKLAASIGLFIIVAAVLQLLFGGSKDLSLLEYYQTSAENKSGGGLLGGFFCWMFTPLFGTVGSYVVLIGIAIFLIMILTGKALFALLAEVSGREVEKQKENYKNYIEERRVIREEKREERERTKSRAQSFLLQQQEEKEKSEVKRNFFGGFSSTVPVGVSVSEPKVVSQKEKKEKPSVATKVEKKISEVKVLEPIKPVTGKVNLSVVNTSKPKSIVPKEESVISTKQIVKDVDTIVSVQEEKQEKQEEKLNWEVFSQSWEEDEEEDEYQGNILSIEPAEFIEEVPKIVTPMNNSLEKAQELDIDTQDYQLSKDTVDVINRIYEEPLEPSFSEQSLIDKRQPESQVAKEAFEHTAYGVSGYQTKKVEKEKVMVVEKPSQEDLDKMAEEAEIAQEELISEYQFPPIDLLSKPVMKNVGNNEEELKQTADKLKTTLESFGVRVTISNVSRGPSVTRYELQPEQGVKVSRITGLADDIKLNLAAADVRIEAPIPGKAAVGIEVPNKENTAVLLRELIESNEFLNHSSNIAFTVGKDIGGQNVVADIGKMPHLLIAGSTGSGKSVCINTIIMSILYKAHPNDVKLIMVDPKVVELSVYNGIPHLLIPVVTDPKKASAALHWAVTEMMQRYDKFATLGVRDLKGYNERVEESAKEGFVDENFPKLPQIVIIVDELADLMMVAPGEVEDAICRLAQMARAAGLHLILATQRPSVNVITGLIKANVPSRIAFAVSSGIDSRTILDSVGAEKLLGKGDMLFFPSGYPKPVRIQGAFVSDKEVSHVVEFLKNQTTGTTSYNEEVKKKIESGVSSDGSSGSSSSGNDNGKDEYFAEAGRFIIEKDKASIGMLQRVYKIGFNRAARIMDQLSEAGVVGPEEGTKPRKILMTQEEFEEYLSM